MRGGEPLLQFFLLFLVHAKIGYNNRRIWAAIVGERRGTGGQNRHFKGACGLSRGKHSKGLPHCASFGVTIESKILLSEDDERGQAE